MTDSETFKRLVYDLSTANRPEQVAWSCLKAHGEYPNLRIAIALDDYIRHNTPDFLKITSIDNKAFIKSYYSSESLYYYDYELFTKTQRENGVKFKTDYSITFDLNVSKLIHKFINKQDLKEQHDISIKIITHILCNNIHVDHVFYLLENIKNIFSLIDYSDKESIEIDKFWELLNKNFKENLISLTQFASIKNEPCRPTNYTPSLSRQDAEEKSKNLAFFFYTGKQQFINEIKVRFRLFKLLLLKIMGHD